MVYLSLDEIKTHLMKGHFISASLEPNKTKTSFLGKLWIHIKKFFGLSVDYRMNQVAIAIFNAIKNYKFTEKSNFQELEKSALLPGQEQLEDSSRVKLGSVDPSIEELLKLVEKKIEASKTVLAFNHYIELIRKDPSNSKKVPRFWKKDEYFMKEAISLDPSIILDSPLLNRVSLAKPAVAASPQLFKSFPYGIRDNIEVCKQAYLQDPCTIEHASLKIKNRKSLVNTQENFKWLIYNLLGSEIQQDIDYWAPSLAANGLRLEWTKALQNSKEACLIAVKNNGLALEYVSPLLANDRELVMAAINQNPLALKYASEALRRSLEITLAVQ